MGSGGAVKGVNGGVEVLGRGGRRRFVMRIDGL